jgi:hypothetical protein
VNRAWPWKLIPSIATFPEYGTAGVLDCPKTDKEKRERKKGIDDFMRETGIFC